MKWKSFEERVIRDSNLDYGTVLYKYPERFYNTYGKGEVVQKKSPFDCMGAIDAKAIMFDCKSLAGKSFSLSQTVFHKKKKHQWVNLSRCHEKGCIAGYLVHFHEQEKIGWISVEAINNAYGLRKKTIKFSEIPVQDDKKPLVLRKLVLDK